jgi:hypothetical protein
MFPLRTTGVTGALPAGQNTSACAVIRPVSGRGPGNEADHSSSSITEVKNTWKSNFTPPYVSMVRFSDRGTGLAGKLDVQEAQGRWCRDE